MPTASFRVFPEVQADAGDEHDSTEKKQKGRQVHISCDQIHLAGSNDPPVPFRGGTSAGRATSVAR